MLHEYQLSAGTIVHIEKEGYAKLIEPDGLEMPMQENKRVYVKQRWLIEWCSLEEVLHKITTNKERFDQLSLSGSKTHRFIFYHPDPRKAKHFYPINSGGIKARKALEKDEVDPDLITLKKDNYGNFF